MANLNLLNKLKCLKATGDKDFSLKTAINNVFKELQTYTSNYAAELKTKVITTISSMAESSVNAIVQPIKSTIEDAQKAYETYTQSAKDSYKKAETLISDVKNASGFLTTSCTDAAEAKTDSPTVNVVGEVLSMPLTNDSNTNNISDDTKFAKNFSDSHSKISSSALFVMSQVIAKLHSELSQKGIYEIREYVRLMKNLHPVIDSYINNLNYFQPISEQVGISYFGYLTDKASLKLSEWSTNLPTLVRKNTNLKIRSDISSELQSAYTNLNKGFASNISNEFYTEINQRGAAYNTSHGFHIAGDALFRIDHMNSINFMTKLTQKLNDVIGVQAVLINYMYPIKPDIRILNDTYSITVENNSINVDKRGNIIRDPFEIINNNALIPILPPEV